MQLTAQTQFEVYIALAQLLFVETWDNFHDDATYVCSQ